VDIEHAIVIDGVVAAFLWRGAGRRNDGFRTGAPKPGIDGFRERGSLVGIAAVREQVMVVNASIG
jgi:hypothetical protein